MYAKGRLSVLKTVESGLRNLIGLGRSLPNDLQNRYTDSPLLQPTQRLVGIWVWMMRGFTGSTELYWKNWLLKDFVQSLSPDI